MVKHECYLWISLSAFAATSQTMNAAALTALANYPFLIKVVITDLHLFDSFLIINFPRFYTFISIFSLVWSFKWYNNKPVACTWNRLIFRISTVFPTSLFGFVLSGSLRSIARKHKPKSMPYSLLSLIAATNWEEADQGLNYRRF